MKAKTKTFDNLADAMSHYKKQNRKVLERRSTEYRQAQKISILKEAKALYQSLYDCAKAELQNAEQHDKQILLEELQNIDIQLGIVECEIMLQNR